MATDVIGGCELYHGDCLDVMPRLSAAVDAVVTDPPYGIGFMGKAWDHGVPGVPFWSAVLRVLNPGGYMLVMGGTRTYHRLACAVEDAGFEIRDCIMWLYGSGFPKHKACLKPAYEPILLARKPGKKATPLGIDECRTEYVSEADKASATPQGRCTAKPGALAGRTQHDGGREEFDRPELLGRYPANVVHDGCDEVMEAFAAFGERNPHDKPRTEKGTRPGGFANVGSENGDGKPCGPIYGDTGTAARFFYCAKASKSERGVASAHPTVKPLALMRWLVRLVSKPGDTVLDPFAGSGTTPVAALLEGRSAVAVEREEAYYATMRGRVRSAADVRTRSFLDELAVSESDQDGRA